MYPVECSSGIFLELSFQRRYTFRVCTKDSSRVCVRLSHAQRVLDQLSALLTSLLFLRPTKVFSERFYRACHCLASSIQLANVYLVKFQSQYINLVCIYHCALPCSLRMPREFLVHQRPHAVLEICGYRFETILFLSAMRHFLKSAESEPCRTKVILSFRHPCSRIISVS